MGRENNVKGIKLPIRMPIHCFSVSSRISGMKAKFSFSNIQSKLNHQKDNRWSRLDTQANGPFRPQEMQQTSYNKSSGTQIIETFLNVLL